MNANQLMNMVMRIIMRKTINKGIDVGINQATRVTRGRPQATSRSELDDAPDDIQNGPTQAQVRQQRKARRAARQARQAAKNGDRSA